MTVNRLFLWVFGILAYFAGGIVAIIGGITTDLKPFRYIVSLLKEDYGHFCVGAIIGEQHVLTAAHCFIDHHNDIKPGRVFALMGTKDLMKMLPPTVNFEVTTVYVPRDYNASDIHTSSDIAVVRLKGRLNVGQHSNLKQAKKLRSRVETFSGQKANIAGWGWNTVQVQGDHVTGGRTDSLLRFAETDVFNNHQCQLDHPHIRISERHLCARTEQRENEIRGVCKEDDGAPLVHEGAVIGVLSKFPFGCTEAGSSAIYTRVTHHLTFIRNSKLDLVPAMTMRQYILEP